MKSLNLSAKYFTLVALLIVFGMFSTGCDLPGGGSDGGTVVVVQPNLSPAPTVSPGPLVDPHAVCDPFNTGVETTTANSGLKASLYYLDPTQPTYGHAKDYSQYGHAIDATLYFNQVYVPTRPFSKGFVAQDGRTIVNNDGNTLYEWFGLHMESVLKLSDSDVDGYYQLALLADDGATLDIQENAAGDFVTNVDDDGVHPTQMGCGSKAIYMDHTTRLPIKLDYYQGPRYHIAVVAMWRKVAANTISELSDALCGQSGNSLFFDSTQDPSTPQPAYNDLLGRGWKPIAVANYLLPGAVANPCHDDGIPVVITDLLVSSIGQSSAVVTWSTNKPSSTQVQSTLQVTGTTTFTPTNEDTNLVTSHSVTLTGLVANSAYLVVAKSRSSPTNGTNSGELSFRTRR